MELKLCELGCGRMFLRPIPKNAKAGEKGCRACWAMSPDQRQAQYEELARREANARRGVMA